MVTKKQAALHRLQQLSQELQDAQVADANGMNPSLERLALAISEILRDVDDASAMELGEQFVQLFENRDVLAVQRTGALPENDVMFIAALARRLEGSNGPDDALRRVVSEAAVLVSAPAAHVSQVGDRGFRPLLTFHAGRSRAPGDGPAEIAFSDGDAESTSLTLGEPAATLDPGVTRNPGTEAVFGYRDYIVLPLPNAPAGPMLVHMELTSDHVVTGSVRIMLQVILDLYTMVVRRIETELPLPAPRALPELAVLTEREKEVLSVLLDGPSNAAVAERLNISLDTVKSHVKSILSKLHAANRAELIDRFSIRNQHGNASSD